MARNINDHWEKYQRTVDKNINGISIFFLSIVQSCYNIFLFSNIVYWSRIHELYIAACWDIMMTRKRNQKYQRPGPWFNIKMTSYQYRKSHCGDKTILRPSYLHNGISYTGKTTSLYWIRPLYLGRDGLLIDLRPPRLYWYKCSL